MRAYGEKFFWQENCWEDTNFLYKNMMQYIPSAIEATKEFGHNAKIVKNLGTLKIIAV